MHDTKRKLVGGLALSAALGLSMAPSAGAAGRAKAPAHRSSGPKKGAAFVGLSGQKSGTLALPVDLRVSPDGNTMSRFDIQWSASCQSQTGRGSYGGLSITLNKKITAGNFTDSGSFTRNFSNGDKGLFTIKLFGQFTSPLRVAGSFEVKVAVTDSAGANTDNCDSGSVAWTATN